jgi:hypothetical protein
LFHEDAFDRIVNCRELDLIDTLLSKNLSSKRRNAHSSYDKLEISGELFVCLEEDRKRCIVPQKMNEYDVLAVFLVSFS